MFARLVLVVRYVRLTSFTVATVILVAVLERVILTLIQIAHSFGVQFTELASMRFCA